MEHDKQIPIWFFIGVLLTIYGVLILGSGIYGWINPPPVDARVALWGYHADVWWGILLVVFGMVFAVKSRPGRKTEEH